MSQSAHDIRWLTLVPVGIIAALFLVPPVDPAPVWLLMAFWVGGCFAAEVLWHPARDGHTPLTMSPATHVAALAALPWTLGIPAIGATAFLGALLWRKEGFVRSVVITAGTIIAGAGALIVLRAGGLAASLTGGGPSLHHAARDLGLVAGAGVLYLVVFQTVRAAITARDQGISIGEAWREAFGRETEIVTSGAVITVAVLASVAYETLGYRGLLLCVMPILFVRDGSRRNVELAAAQAQLIKNERLAAKGEMAAEIGHELNNYLAAISGRAQLLLRSLGGGEMTPLAVESTRVRDIANRMAELSRGLMDFSHRETRRTQFGVNELIEKTVEFVRPQTKFRTWNFELAPEPGIPPVEMDPGQIQQVLLILLGRVAEETPAGDRRLTVKTFAGEDRKSVGIEIAPAAGIEKTPEDGEPGSSSLATVRRILERQRGRLELAAEPEGTSVRLVLPAA